MSAIPNEFEMNYRQSTISDFFNADQELFAMKLRGHHNFLGWLKLVEDSAKVKVAKVIGVHEPFWTMQQFLSNQGRIYKHRFLGAFACEKSQSELFSGAFYANWYPKDFWVDTDEYLAALKRACINLGVRFEQTGPLVKVHSNDKQVFTVFDSGDVGVCERIILCVGAGLSVLEVPDRGFSATLSGVSGATYVGDFKNKEFSQEICVVNQLNTAAIYGEKIYLGSTSFPKQDLADAVEVESVEGSINSINTIVKATFGDDKSVEIPTLQCRLGTRVRTKNRMPYVGYCGSDRKIIMNTGYYKSGLTLTPLGAKKVEELLSKSE